ncbi:hypothetical protein SNEBB_010540 [Seison nebaliae]|nr:hypothetical protein SNEBB_010540 [Seison nebaliae]
MITEIDEDLSFFGAFAPQIQLKFDTDVMCLSCHPEDNIVAIGLIDGTINVLERAKFKLLKVLKYSSKKAPITELDWLRTKDRYLLVSSDSAGHLMLWNWETVEMLKVFKEKQQIFTFCISNNQDSIFTGGSDAIIRQYDLGQKILINTLEASSVPSSIDGHVNRIYSLRANKNDDNKLYSGGWDKTIHIWDVHNKISTCFIFGPHIGSNTIDIDSDRNEILTGSYRHQDPLQVWSGSTCKLLKNYNLGDHPTQLYCCRFFEDNDIIIGGVNANFLGVLNRETSKFTASLKNSKCGFQCLDICVDRPLKISGKKDRLLGPTTTVYGGSGKTVFVMNWNKS